MLKILLLPFSLLYGLAVFVRNKCFDLKILRSTEFEIPLICTGNLSVGGTGKTPHIEYLVALLNDFYKTGTLSRGYGRKSSGFLLADINSSANEIGDEPSQIKRKFPSVMVAVGEDRVLAIPEMLAVEPDLQVILLDDAFQHRPVKAGLNILLTAFDQPFYSDWLLPSGRLREQKSGAARADIVIITRCPAAINSRQKTEIENHIKTYNATAPVFFDSIKYGQPYSLFNKDKSAVELGGLEVLLVCGIAKPSVIKEYLEAQGCKIVPLFYPDHYNFREPDLEKIKAGWNNIHAVRKLILTTEKDASRFIQYKEWFNKNRIDIWVLPIEIEFTDEDKNRFNKLIFDFLKSFFQNAEPVTAD